MKLAIGDTVKIISSGDYGMVICYDESSDELTVEMFTGNFYIGRGSDVRVVANRERWESAPKPEETDNKCRCELMMLMRNGCKCGGN